MSLIIADQCDKSQSSPGNLTQIVFFCPKPRKRRYNYFMVLSKILGKSIKMDQFVVIFELCVASPQLKFLTVGYFGLYFSLGKMLYFASMEIP